MLSPREHSFTFTIMKIYPFQVKPRKNKIFYENIKPFLIIFQFLGFHPIKNLYRADNESRYLRFDSLSWPTVYSLLLYLLSPFLIIYLKNPDLHSFKYFFYVVEYIQIMVLGFYILLPLKTLIKLIQKLQNFDITIGRHNAWKHDLTRALILRKRFFVYLIICILFRIVETLIFFIRSEFRATLELYFQIYSLTPANLNSFLFVYLCTAIRFRFRNLNCTLQTIITHKRINMYPKALESIRSHHLELIDCQYLLDKCFGKYMSWFFFFTLINGLIIIYEVTYFPNYIPLNYLFHLLWHFICIYFVVISSDGMLVESTESRKIIFELQTAELPDCYQDEVLLFQLQIETLIDRVQERNVLSINRELFGSFTLLFVLYFITVIQLGTEINSLVYKYFNVQSEN